MTLNLGIIGTNSITNVFVDAALESGLYTLKAVYSRSVEKAESFGKPYGADVFETDLTVFAQHSEIDIVYIASPNSLHFDQAVELMKHGKHVIVEKPMFSNPDEWKRAAQTANENKVFLFDAARHIHEENFQRVKAEVQNIENIQGANFTYMKYSSRYDNVLSGEEPNIFSLKFSGGALADLGVYLVYAAISWFGMPQSSHYFAQKVTTGVDGKGTMILRYPTFDVTMQTGKIASSYLPSEIYGLNKTISLDGITGISAIEVIDRKTGLKDNIAKSTQKTPMIEEAIAFADVINHPEDEERLKDYQEWTNLSQQVNQVLYELRTDAGIVYPAD
ncbi:Gfo/Idh/MocA family oxidoreductase [Desemzia sp. RIT804]|uniref:Gfo/Idh/MocA family protein n=1 Tax=Desemzia sp. RIT 804 TaxID=2810209 RepID=UPI00194F62C4|nr:Gfo/Idh/MocA family oxidoreductase [Desemzia sp. RIT 804]MBM6614317.1 Gfo/Idh/MocA family oxidoreductase [Desemzia sp. RIT 804]